MTKIYTRTGDKGETSLFTGDRVPKNNPFIDALGTVDECNCAIGSALAFLPTEAGWSPLRDQLIVIQHALFDVGAALATPQTRASPSKLKVTRFDSRAIELLEQWIDAMEMTLPKLHTFILPGGHPAGAMLHLGRSFCRRAERCVIPLRSQEEVSSDVLIYLNRLSDYLFVASRFINYGMKCPETTWQHHKTPL